MSTNRNAAISVIVPVYKVEPYLRCCIDSILAQTFTDFELILVDDGSPDNCGAICDEYAAKDDRIVVIHQENQGVSVARNAALDWCFFNSDSRWITFVDSDDAIIPEYLEILLQFAAETGADVVTTSGFHFTDDAELIDIHRNVDSCAVIEGKQNCILYFNSEGDVSPYPWGKLCRKELFADLRFSVGIAYKEDEELIGKLIYIASGIAVVRAGLYCYRQRADSVAHETFSLNRYGHIEGLDSCIAFFQDKQEKAIVDSIKNRKEKYLAKYMLLAHGSKLTEQVPDKYKMPIWRAFFITVKDTICRGGMKFIIVRIRHFIKRVER